MSQPMPASIRTRNGKYLKDVLSINVIMLMEARVDFLVVGQSHVSTIKAKCFFLYLYVILCLK